MADAQKVAVSSASTSSGGEVTLTQAVLRVFPGDEVTLAFATRVLNNDGGVTVDGELQFYDSADALVEAWSAGPLAPTSFTRYSIAGEAPEDSAYVKAVLFVRWASTDADGDAWFKDTRFLRASSDPATYANPHVSGGSQTGDTLDTAGWPASTANVLRAGDVFRVGGSAETKAAAETDEVFRSFEVLADVDSDGSGLATVPIDPPIFSGLSLPDGAALRFSGMRMRVGMPRANLPQPSQMVDKYAGISTTLVETL